MEITSRTTMHLVLRHTIYLLLLFPIQRSIADLMPLWPVPLLYLPSFLLLGALEGRPRSGAPRFGAPRSRAPRFGDTRPGDTRPGAGRWILPAGLLLGTSGILLGTFWVAAGLAGAGGWWEERLLFAGTELLPATALAFFVLIAEIWYRSGRNGRALFVPAVTAVVVATFWSQADFRTELFGHPSWYAVYAGLLTATVVAHQASGPRPGLNGTRTTEGDAGRTPRSGTTRRFLSRALPVLALLLVLLSTLGFVYRGWQNRAVTAGGGLLQPTLFRFDFSDYITLEPEIQLSRDLVFLYREDSAPPDRLLRRYVLSGYEPRRGFYRLDAEDEPSGAPPLSVRSAAEGFLPAGGRDGGAVVVQEYYVINLDPDALIAVNQPEAVRLLPAQGRSSFNGAYRVRSRHPEDTVLDLLAAQWPADLPEGWRETYLSGPISPLVAALAADITADAESYFETILAVVTHLHEEYYYSLSPGESLRGDQIEHFLFESRKGYCSYFAFSMTLMLRSLGVPSRVAVGFFIDPAASMLGFYPVRGDMAHAWVEVWFDGIGWVEFDPTSTTIAPGEVVATDYEIDQERLSALIQEILAGDGGEPEGTPPGDATADEERTSRARWAIALPGGIIALGAAVAGWYLRRRRRWNRLRREVPRQALLLLARRARSLVSAADRDGAGNRGVVAGRDLGAPAADRDVVVRGLDRARFARAVSPAELSTFELRYREILERPAGSLGSALRRWWYRRIPPRVGKTGASLGRGGRWVILLACVIAGVAPTPEAQVAPDATVDGGRALGTGDAGLPGDPAADPAASADDLLETVRAAMDGENYERSLRLLREGRQGYPEDYRFPLLQGDLYFGEGLFDLAADAYDDALALGAPAYSTSYMISRALSRLNRNAEAARMLETLYRQDAEDLAVIGDLGWLYFKMHRLEEARDLLEDAIAELGSDRDLMMTLATVYSGLWDYDAARRQYEGAIEDGLAADDRVFLAVAYYNLSILHANFYRYDEALATAERSLEMSERPSGYMIRAELRELRLADDAAADDYSRAAVLDQVTPLAHLSLAALWIRQGHPDRALARLDRVTGDDAGNWIYNYGTDPDRYQRQVYGLYADAWEAQARVMRLQRPGDMVDRIVRWGRSVQAHARAWYYRGLERRRRRRIADAYAVEGRDLLAGWNRMVAAEPWPRIAARYAAEAAAIETVFNPEADLDYRLFVAGMTGDRRELEALASEMSGPWRRRDRSAALRELYRHASGTVVGREAAIRAWVAEPGAFVVSGLRVPVALVSHPDEAGPRDGSSGKAGISSRRQRRVLRRMGFRLDEANPLRLELRWETGLLAYRITDGRSGALIRRGTVRHGGDSVAALEEMATELTRGVSPDTVAATSTGCCHRR